MVGMAFSSLSGLAATMLVSREFGTSADLDAFYAANRLTEIIFNLMAGGALASAFVPVYTELLSKNKHTKAWQMVSAIGNLLFLSMGAIAILAAIIAPWLVENVIAPGFREASQIRLTVELLRIMLASSVIFGLSGLIMGVLNARQHFILPALAPAFYRFGWIFGILVLVPRWGIRGLAWGVVLGAGLHLLIQIPGLIGSKLKYIPQLRLRDPDVRQVALLMGPRILGVAIVQINFLVNTILASGQPEGSLAALSFALALMIMPQAIIAQAPAIAALPTFSEQVAKGNLQALRSSFVSTLRGVIFLALPASIGLILLREPLVSLLLQRGAFGGGSSQMVSWALLWYALGLMGHALLEIIVRAFYAMKDTRTPVLIGASAMTLNLLFSLFFAYLFRQIGWAPHGGLALANSLATALESLLLLFILQKRLPGLDLFKMIRGLRPVLVSASLMALFLYLWGAILSDLPVWVVGLGGVILGAGIYWILANLLRAQEVQQFRLFDRFR